MLQGGEEGSHLLLNTSNTETNAECNMLLLIVLSCTTSSVLQPTSMCVCMECCFYIQIITVELCMYDTSNSCFNTTSRWGDSVMYFFWKGVAYCYGVLQEEGPQKAKISVT